MHLLSKVVYPVLFVPGGWPSEEMWTRVNNLRLDLQDWYIEREAALSITSPLTPFPPSGEFLWRGGQGSAIVWQLRDYLVERGIPTTGDHIVLAFVKGATKKTLTTGGWGTRGLCIVAWDMLEEAASFNQQRWLEGVVAHELGHGMGFGHYQTLPEQIMWHWWNYPNVRGVPLAGARAYQMRVDDPCPLRPVEEV